MVVGRIPRCVRKGQFESRLFAVLHSRSDVSALEPADGESGRDWGTISYKVGILAKCPVLLIK